LLNKTIITPTRTHRIKSDDIQSIRNASDELMRVSQEVGQALYAAGAADQAGQQTAGGFAGGEGAGGDEDIVDAEVVDEPEDDEGVA
jgi:molecular chaperone DnaK